jgi:hypothetical protein
VWNLGLYAALHARGGPLGGNCNRGTSMSSTVTIFAVSAALILVPLGVLIRDLFVAAFPRRFVITDEKGKVVGEISADTVMHDDSTELRRLHHRIRQRYNEPTAAA